MSHPTSSSHELTPAFSRREFLSSAGAGLAAVHLPAVARAASRSRPREGAVAYA